jgi:hypothetical protein
MHEQHFQMALRKSFNMEKNDGGVNSVILEI